MSAKKKIVSAKRPLPPKPSPVLKTVKAKVKQIPVEEPVVDDDNEGEEDVNDEQGEEEQPERVPRKKPTITDHINNYNSLFELLDAEIDRKSRTKEKGARTLRTIRKTLTQMRKEVPQVTRSKSARLQYSKKKETNSGLMMGYTISTELADFLKISHDTRLSRVEATRAICVYAHLKEDEKREPMLRWKYLNPGGKRNLQFPQDKKAIIPDKALSKLLRYDEYKKKVSAGLITYNVKDKETGKKNVVKVKTDALYYWAIQTLLGIHFLDEGSDDGEETQDQ